MKTLKKILDFFTQGSVLELENKAAAAALKKAQIKVANSKVELIRISNL